MPSPWGCPRPACVSWVGPGRLQNPRRPSRSRRRRPSRPRPSPSSSRRGSSRQPGPRPGQGGRPFGAPPALSRTRSRPPLGAGTGAAEEPSEAPESETSRRRRRRRREEGEEEWEEGRAGWEKRKKVLRLFRCYCKSETRGLLSAALSCTEAGPEDSRQPCSPSWILDRATRRSSDAPIPDQPSGATSSASREDFTPKLGRTPCTPPSPPACL